jgi:hypothetical protein
MAEDKDDYNLPPTERRNQDAADQQRSHSDVQAGIDNEKISPTLGPFSFWDSVDAVLLNGEKPMAVTLVHDRYGSA